MSADYATEIDKNAALQYKDADTNIAADCATPVSAGADLRM